MSYVLSRDGSLQGNGERYVADSQIADQRIFSTEEVVGSDAPAGAGNVLALV